MQTVNRIVLLAGLTLVVCLYWPGLSGPFVLDDYPALGPILDASGQDFYRLVASFLYSDSGPLHRPISMFSFIVDVYLHGTNIWWWKLTNVIIHLLCAVLIYAFCLQLFRRMNQSNETVSQGLALFISLLWSLHPLNVSTVLYTVQRMTELSAMFSLLGLFCYMIGRNFLWEERQIGWAFIGFALLGCLPLAALSKENGLLMLPMIGLIEYFCYRSNSNRRQLTTSNWFLTVLVVIPSLVVLVYLSVNFSNLVLNGYTGREFGLSERLLTEARVVCLYLFQILYPNPLNLGFYHDDITLSSGLFNPITTVFSISFLLGLLVLAVVFRNRQPLFSFGILFFFVGHVMESSIFPLEIMFEHRNYLPMLGVLIATTNVFLVFIKDKRLLAGLGGIVTILFGVLLLNYTSAWSSEQKLFPYLYRSHPNSERLNAIIVNNYADRGNYAVALKLLSKFNSYGAAINALVIECRRTHQLSDSQLQSAMQKVSPVIDSYSQIGLIRLANMGLDNQCQFSDGQFIELIKRTLAKGYLSRLDRQNIAIYLAHYLHKQGRLNDAINVLKLSRKNNKKNPVPLFLIVHWLLESGNVTMAQEYYKKALEITKQNRGNYKNMISDIEKQFHAGKRHK